MIRVLDKPIPFGGGVALPPNKARSLEQSLAKAKLPDVIKFPLRQGARPLVKAGDTVLKGQIIIEAQDYINVPIHASTSGVVREIAEHAIADSSAAKSVCIVIETDGKETWVDGRNPMDDYSDLSPIEVQQKIWQAGITNLGRVRFPSAVKNIPDSNSDIELLILNAVECEPYISCDETLIRHHAKELISGLEILAYALEVNECVIAIEDNKIEAIDVLKEALEQYAKTDIRLILVSSLYPAGGEKQLIKSITGIEDPSDSSPMDVGMAIYNVGTAVAVKKAIIDDEALISRVVTVTGPGINQACNLDVLIGTPINEIIEQCGGYNERFEYLIMGGSMMGFRVHDDHVPLIQSTNCLLAFATEPQTADIQESACIRCDECAPVCPVNLQPQQLHWHSKEFNNDRLQDYNLFDCIECGCCSYVCPSHIPLVDEYRQAKSNIWNKRERQLKAEQNKKRYLAKLARLEQQEKDKINKRSIIANEKTDEELAMKKRKDEIAAAVNRVRQKRKEKEN